MAAPRGDFSLKTSRSESPAISREPSRKVSSSPAILATTIMPGSTMPSSAGASPTWTSRRRAVSWRMRASILPCSSLAAWYPPFSLRSPSCRAASIFWTISARPAPERWSSSAFRRSKASWVSQAAEALLVVDTDFSSSGPTCKRPRHGGHLWSSNQLSGVKVSLHCSQSSGDNPTSKRRASHPLRRSGGNPAAVHHARHGRRLRTQRDALGHCPAAVGRPVRCRWRNVHHLPAHHRELGVQRLHGTLDGVGRFPGDLEVHFRQRGIGGAVSHVLVRHP